MEKRKKRKIKKNYSPHQKKQQMWAKNHELTFSSISPLQPTDNAYFCFGMPFFQKIELTFFAKSLANKIKTTFQKRIHISKNANLPEQLFEKFLTEILKNP